MIEGLGNEIVATGYYSIEFQTKSVVGDRELCQFLMALGRRSVNPESFPAEGSCTKILDVSIADTKALKVTEFLSRMKFGPKFDHACKVRADREKHDRKHEEVPTKEVIPKVKE